MISCYNNASKQMMILMLKCLFGCSDLRYVREDLVGGGLDGATSVSVYVCLKCNKEHRKKENR